MSGPPEVAADVWALAPDFRAFSIVLERTDGSLAPGSDDALTRAEQEAREGRPAWAEAHMAAWGAAYRAFGARPNRTPCSAAALRKRVVAQGALPRINPLVDLYNAISLRFAVPVGGEDADRYAGPPRLVRAVGDERFDTQTNGQPSTEAPEPGEVVWRDDVGVTCRRWNWRQGVRTRLDGSSRRMWFILESLDAMPLPALLEAGEQLRDGLLALCPGAQAGMTLIEPP